MPDALAVTPPAAPAPPNAIEAVERVTALFKLERMVYIGATAVAMLMLLANVGMLLYEKKAGPAELTLCFGSTGLIAISASRLIKMWDRSIDLVEKLSIAPPKAAA